MRTRRSGRARRLAVVAAFALAISGGVARAGNPYREWKTVETRHFVVHYYLPLTDVAQRVAVVAERAHRVLTPVFEHEPDEKTQVVVTDANDGANGFARVIPRNTINVYASAPSGLSALSDHDDWLYGLVAHEYTHILHLDSIGGLPQVYNEIFGKTWAPNQVQPRWLIEGIATYEESKRSSGGRTRNALFDMNLRMAYLSGEHLDLDHISTGPRHWPHGNAAYLYGSHFLKYVFDRYGDDKLADLSWIYGEQPIPYGLNHAIAQVLGKRYPELYEEWRAHLRAKYELQREAVERRGRREGHRLTFSGELSFTPRFSRAGDLVVWLESDGVHDDRFLAMPTGTNIGRAFEYLDTERVGGFDLLADGDMVLEQTTAFRASQSYQELYRWDRQSGELTQLTYGQRARSPAVSPDESRVAFVKNGESRRAIAVMPLRERAEHRVVWSGPDRFDQAYTPRWSPDGDTLAFSAWTKGGYRDLYVLDVASGRARRLWRDRAMDTDPVFGPDGRTLYFSSDRTGIYNIYAYELDGGELHQVTNVLGCALFPTVSPDGERLIYVGSDGSGYDLFEIALDRDRWQRAQPYINDRPEPVDVRASEAEVSAPRDYRPLETLAPQNYRLNYSLGSDFASATINTGGADVAGLHRYNVGVSLDSTGRVGFGGSYSYTGLWPSLGVSVSRYASRRGGVILDGENTSFTEEALGASVRTGLPLLRTAESGARISLGYDFDWLRNTDDEMDGYDPNDLVPRFPETDVVLSGLSLGLSYSDLDGTTYTVGAQEGKAVSINLRMDHPALGSDFHALSLGYRWEGFMPLPWQATLAVRATGGIRSSDRRRAGVYSLGGVPDQDIIRSIRESRRSGVWGYLRGYPSRVARGHQYHLANLEYRQKIVEVEEGFSTLPLYVRRLHIAGLCDVGNAFDGPFEPEELKVSVGGAVRLDMVFGYFVPGAVDIGYARGLTGEGRGEYWLLLTGTL